MNYRTVIRFLLLCLSAAAVMWALVRIAMPGDGPGLITFEVSNTGLPLRREEYVVQAIEASSGQLVATSADSGDTLKLTPGDYHIKAVIVGSHPEQFLIHENQTIQGDRAVRFRFDFSYGELDVRHATEYSKMPGERVIVEVFSAAQRARRIVAYEAGQYMKLAPGTYDVRVVLNVESRERHVRWHEGVVIEAGLQRSLLNNFERGFVFVNATDNGEPIPFENTLVSVYAGGDPLREVLQSGAAQLPMSLASGNYDIEVKYIATADEPSRVIEGVVVVDQQTSSVPAAFATATVVTKTRLGEILLDDGFAAYTYVYTPKDHSNAIAYAAQKHALVLSPGTYDLRVALVDGPAVADVWSYGQELAAGEHYDLELRFDAGYLLVHAMSASGRELIGEETIISIHPPGARELPIASTVAGVKMLLPIGEFDVVVKETYGGEVETARVVIEASGIAEPTVVFREIE